MRKLKLTTMYYTIDDPKGKRRTYTLIFNQTTGEILEVQVNFERLRRVRTFTNYRQIVAIYLNHLGDLNKTMGELYADALVACILPN